MTEIRLGTWSRIQFAIWISGSQAIRHRRRIRRNRPLRRPTGVAHDGAQCMLLNMSADTFLASTPAVDKVPIVQTGCAQVLDNVEAALRWFRLVRPDDIHATLSSSPAPLSQRMPTGTHRFSHQQRSFHRMEKSRSRTRLSSKRWSAWKSAIRHTFTFRNRQLPICEEVQTSGRCLRGRRRMLDVLGEVAKRYDAGSLGATFALVVERELKSLRFRDRRERKRHDHE